MDPTGGFQAKVDFVGEASYGYTPYSPHKPPFLAHPKPIYSHPKPIYSPPKPTFSPPKPIYAHHQPSYAKPYLQAAPSNYHPSFSLPQSPSYNNIIYTPSSYIPAPIQVSLDGAKKSTILTKMFLECWSWNSQSRELQAGPNPCTSPSRAHHSPISTSKPRSWGARNCNARPIQRIRRTTKKDGLHWLIFLSLQDKHKERLQKVGSWKRRKKSQSCVRI